MRIDTPSRMASSTSRGGTSHPPGRSSSGGRRAAETATEDREAKAQEKASKLQKAAEDKGDLADTTATRDADQTYLDDLVAECTQKSSDFESRQQLRTDELAAIDKAIEILSSGAVSGNADKHLPGFVQKSVSFLQLSARAQQVAEDAANGWAQLSARAGNLMNKIGSSMQKLRKSCAAVESPAMSIDAFESHFVSRSSSR